MRNLILLRYKYYALTAILLSIGLVACNSDNDIPYEPDPELSGMRPVTVNSSADADCVYDWTPAPGQFINETLPGTDWSSATTLHDACVWAKARLDERLFVSLGGFGGYIVVGFDHSIVNTGSGYEIGVLGNAFNSGMGHSNEPGIVYVMKDTNGNGQPDDTWYELRGSDTFADGTIQNYSVTYYRPVGDCMPVKWVDIFGQNGEIPYVEMFHKQSSYYPVWVTPDSYTLSGTCLSPRNGQDPSTGNWSNDPFDWGYADNRGSDNISYQDNPNCNRFRISDAIDKNGNSVNLPYIDFVKIQTGVNSASGWLGEVSTEVLGVVDLSL